MVKRKPGWSREARTKGKGVDRSAVQFHKNNGRLAILIDSDKQKGFFQKIDYIVILKGILGQGKYKKEYLHKPEKDIILSNCKEFPNTELTAELAWRGARFQRVKIEPIS